MSLSLCAFILCFCRAFVRRERVLVLCCPTAEAYKDFSQQIRTSTACVPGQWMEQTGRDWLLIIALDVGGMWRERGWDNRRTDTQECLQRPVPDTYTHSLKHTFSEQVSCSPAHTPAHSHSQRVEYGSSVWSAAPQVWRCGSSIVSGVAPLV